MRLLLVVDSTTDVFIFNYVKWLKFVRPEIDIDVFGWDADNSQHCDASEYAHLTNANVNKWFLKIKYFSFFIRPFYLKNQFERFLNSCEEYDIIHCHHVVPACVLTSTYKKHCKKLYCTFWGNEEKNFSILHSNRLFVRFLRRYLHSVDAIVNSSSSIEMFRKSFINYPEIKYFSANLGAAPLDALQKLMPIESKMVSKELLKFPVGKRTVMIGYSGKQLHQHLLIISSLVKHPELIDKIHIIAPMTRGADHNYVDKVDAALSRSGFTYTIFRNRFLSDEEVARIRNATDVTLQLSTSDGFSRSIVECFCAKSLVIYGSWLQNIYKPHLKEFGLSAISVPSIEDGVLALQDIDKLIDSNWDMLESNSENGFRNNLWSQCILNWVKAYQL